MLKQIKLSFRYSAKVKINKERHSETDNMPQSHTFPSRWDSISQRTQKRPWKIVGQLLHNFTTAVGLKHTARIKSQKKNTSVKHNYISSEKTSQNRAQETTWNDLFTEQYYFKITWSWKRHLVRHVFYSEYVIISGPLIRQMSSVSLPCFSPLVWFGSRLNLINWDGITRKGRIALQ